MPHEAPEDLSFGIAICRQQLAATTDPQTRDVLQVMIENMEERLDTLVGGHPLGSVGRTQLLLPR